ncbi:MAG: hypothetical protein ACYTEZ_03480 [Planctomycetota bacterium]|jgi:hypothetical protein
MWAALRLRLLEAHRRGGLWLLLLAMLVVLLVARFGGDTVDGRYGLATDVAAALAYLAAVFFGAFPLAIDRERRRAYLPGASPVSPWQWALGNAAGATLVGGAAAFALFLAAGLGAGWSGGIATHAVTRVGGRGTRWLKPGVEIRITDVPEDAQRIRLVVRSYLAVADAVGTPDAATIEVDGARYEVYPDQTIVVPITPPRVEIRSLSPAFAVGVAREKIRVLRGERPFLLNALGSGVPPALGAGAVAAFGAAAGAHLSSAVAALLTTLVLLLASLKGFLLETFEHEGKTRAAVEHEHVAREPRPSAEQTGVRRVARAFVEATLLVLPDLSDLDRTDRAALGEWTGVRRAGSAALILLAALLFAAVVGGVGVQARRTP